MAGKNVVKGSLLAEVLSAGHVSNLDTSDREQIEYIDIDRLDDDPNNFYELRDVETLASNIQLCGLQQPIRVRAGAGDRLTIVSGHRRRAALRHLVGEGLERFRLAPCIREGGDVSPAFQELRLIFANASTRELTPAEKMHQAERTELLLYQLKEEGHEFPGRMRDQVAEACQVSASKLARLKVIRENLIPAYMEQFETNALSEQAAYQLAGLPMDVQERCARVYKKVPKGGGAETVREKVEAGCTYLPDFQCPDGTVCRHGDAFLRHDLDSYRYQACGGTQCCLQCREAMSSYGACESSCSKVKALRKENAEEERAAGERSQQKRVKTAEGYAAQAKEFVDRLRGAMEAAGMAMDGSALKEMGVAEYEMPALLRLAGDAYQVSQYDDARRYLPRALELAAICGRLNCDPRYLLGMPCGDASSGVEAGWQRGWPPVPGFYFCLTPNRQDAKLYYWSGSRWEFSSHDLEVGVSLSIWCPAPLFPPELRYERKHMDDAKPI